MIAAGGLTVDIQIEPPTPQQTMIGGFKGFKPSKSASRKGAGSTIHSGNASSLDFIHTTIIYSYKHPLTVAVSNNFAYTSC